MSLILLGIEDKLGIKLPPYWRPFNNLDKLGTPPLLRFWT